MRRLLFLVAIAASSQAATYTVTQVAAIDCWTAGCGGRVHNGDTTIFTAWASSGSVSVEGVAITGNLYGTTNDSDIYYNGGNSTLGPNCSGRNIVWLQIPSISVTGAGGTIYTKNCMAGYGGAPGDGSWAPAASGTCTLGYSSPSGCNWKSQGTMCVDGVCYLHVQRQRQGDGSFAHDTTLIKTTDQGATWLNPSHIGGTPDANGDVPAGPGSASYPASMMWIDGAGHDGASQKIGRLEFFVYGRDGATLPNVDNNGTYLYAIAYSGDFKSWYLARVLRANMANLSAADWSYYVCPGYATAVCDGSLSGSWSSLSAATKLGADYTISGYTPLLGGVMYLSEIGTYVSTGGCNGCGGSVSILTAPHPWGPWVSSGHMSDNPLGLSPPANLNFVSPILATAKTITTGSVVEFTVAANEYTYDSVSPGGTPAFVTYRITKVGAVGLFPLPGATAH